MVNLAQVACETADFGLIECGSGFIYISSQCAFVAPPFGFPSNNERNQFYGPGFWDWDVTLAKKMNLTERVKAELRFEGYNILNHPHFLNPGTDAADLGNLIDQGQLASLRASLRVLLRNRTERLSARQIQVALKITF